MRKLLLGFLSLLMLGQFAAALPAGAQLSANQEAVQLLQQTGLGGATSPEQAGRQLPILIGRIIRVLISLLGIIFLVLIVYAGFLWMTARGESDTVEKAKNILRQAIIGLIIIFLAYALTGFIIDAVIKATAA